LVLLATFTVASLEAVAAPLAVTALSTRANLVSGGDVLVRIDYPAGQLLPLWVTLNDKDVTGQFRPGAAPNTWMGLVSGLNIGNNVLRVRTKAPAGDTSLTITNHPITGPVISGPHETPYYCMTQNVLVPGSSTDRLGPALDADCSINTRVDYVYRSTANTF